MSRSVGNDCALAEHVNFLLCTNPLMSLFRVWCGGSFQGSREEDDTIWSRRVKSQSLGMPPWFIPAYFKKTQASKLGDSQGIPSLSTTYQVPLVKLYFYSVTSYVLYLERLFVFIFVFVWIKSDPSIPCLGERHAPLFRMNTCVLRYTFNVHGEGWNCFVHCYMVGNRKCFMW